MECCHHYCRGHQKSHHYWWWLTLPRFRCLLPSCLPDLHSTCCLSPSLLTQDHQLSSTRSSSQFCLSLYAFNFDHHHCFPLKPIFLLQFPGLRGFPALPYAPAFAYNPLIATSPALLPAPPALDQVARWHVGNIPGRRDLKDMSFVLIIGWMEK